MPVIHKTFRLSLLLMLLAFAACESRVSGATCTVKSLQVLITSPSSGQPLNPGQPVSLAAKVVDSCGNPVFWGGAVVATFSSGDPQVRLVSIGNGNWQGTWT